MPNNFNKRSFGKKLTTVRKESNLSIDEIVNKIDQMNSEKLLKMEEGKLLPSLQIFLKLCNIYQVKIEYFINF